MKPLNAWHFKFSEAKCFVLEKSKVEVLIRGQLAYMTDSGTSKSVCKLFRSYSGTSKRVC